MTKAYDAGFFKKSSDFQLSLKLQFKYYSGKSGKNRNPKKVNFTRYADDFIVTADSEETAKEIMELIELFLKERGLELSEKKTLITHIDEGFDFLG